MNVEEKVDLILEYLWADEFLDDLIGSIGSRNIEEHLDYIIRMNDIPYAVDDDDEEEE